MVSVTGIDNWQDISIERQREMAPQIIMKKRRFFDKNMKEIKLKNNSIYNDKEDSVEQPERMQSDVGGIGGSNFIPP